MLKNIKVVFVELRTFAERSQVELLNSLQLRTGCYFVSFNETRSLDECRHELSRLGLDHDSILDVTTGHTEDDLGKWAMANINKHCIFMSTVLKTYQDNAPDNTQEKALALRLTSDDIDETVKWLNSLE